MAYLTTRQRDVLGFIRERIDQKGVAPTLQEISDAFGFSSTASAQKHVLLLEKKGFLKREKHQKRGLVLTEQDSSSDERIPMVPLMGVVAAGAPIESIPDDESVSVPPQLLGRGEHFVLRVRGQSMEDEGIQDGDLVVIQTASTAVEGDMVVALVSGEVTLKRFFRAGNEMVRLQPSNPAYPPILAPARDVQIQGIVISLLRRY